MRTITLFFALWAFLFYTAGPTNAALIAFVNNPTTNSTDWATAVTGLGGTINSNVNFNTHPLGSLIPGFYTISDGVTLTPSGDVNTVQFGTGPAQGNTFSAPLSPGEGPHAASNFLFDGGSPSSLTITFATPTLGAGLFVIDYFNPLGGNNPLTIEAFTGPNGTGTSLGVATSASFNFQNNNKYFMGVISTNNDLRSIVFRDVNSSTGDTTGIDDIRVARLEQQSVPEPTTMTLWGLCVVGAGVYAYRRRNPARAASEPVR